MIPAGTHENLFIPEVDPHSLFEKEASIARMPDDEKKWPAQAYSELHKALPFLSKYDVDIVFDRLDPESGYALGYAMVRNKSVKNQPVESLERPENRVKIPIIVEDRQLQPFHTFELGGSVYALTGERLDSAMVNPSVFDSSVKSVPRSRSLVDHVYPPYQQRQGFGRIAEPNAAGLGGLGGSKSASAPVDLLEEWGEVGQAKLAGMADAPNYRHAEGSQICGNCTHFQNGKCVKFDFKANAAYTCDSWAPRTEEKSASRMLTFQAGVGMPGTMVFPKMEPKPKLRPGVVPNDFWFFPLRGTPFWMGIHRSYRKRLEKEQDQRKMRQILAGPMRAEMMAARANMPSPGQFILTVKKGDAFVYVQPEFTPALAMAGGGSEQAGVDQSLKKAADALSHDHLPCSEIHPGVDHETYIRDRERDEPKEASVGLLKEALYGRAIPSSGEYGSHWLAKFASTPFYEDALELQASEAEYEASAAMERAKSSLRRAAEAQLEVKTAQLEANFARWKRDNSGMQMHEIQAKLADWRSDSRKTWSDFFASSPFHKEALQLEVADAEREVRRAQDRAEDEARWRDREKLHLKAASLDAQLAQWRLNTLYGEKAASAEGPLSSFLKEAGTPFLEQDRPAKVKEIYRALKREHGEAMPAEVKARIAARKGKASPEARKPPETGGPAHKAPIHHKRVGHGEKARYVEKEAEALPVAGSVAGLVGGYYPGKSLAKHTANIASPRGEKTKAQDIAHKAAIVGAPLGGLAALYTAKRYHVPARAELKHLARYGPKGGALFEGAVEREALKGGIPLLAGLGGSMAGGVATGGAVAGGAHLKQKLEKMRRKKKESS